jgi:Lrp/AsnC family transcriptional regulator, leucine-responsive regulatory protein
VPANRRATGGPADDGLLDETNRRLLDELQRDGRASIAELGRRVGLSSPAVAERLKRLEAEGVVTGFRAEVDARKLGYGLGVIIRVRPGPRLLAEVAALARETPEVVECHRVTGDDCYVMTAYVRDVEHLEALIDGFAPYGQTTSSVMQSSPVPRRGLPALGAPERAAPVTRVRA